MIARRALLEVLDGGFLTTLQDGGRAGFGHLGVPIGGACDPWGLAVANLLVGNRPTATALEATIVGPELRVLGPTVIGIGGADLGGLDRSTGRRLEPGASHSLPAGAIVAFPGPPAGGPGARAYLAVPGGFDVPTVLGSAATCLVGGFGGHEGRALRHGDVLVGAGHALAHEPDPTGDERWPGAAPPHDGPATLRILPGADGVGLDPGRADAARRVLVATAWTVSPASDRMGLRLDGPADRRSTVEPTVLASHGVVWGAIQLPPDGRPIVLLADHQPTGGYPVVAVVISADRSVLGQLRPGDGVRFVETSVGPAVEALRQRVHDFERAAASVREGAGWDALWRGAGG